MYLRETTELQQAMIAHAAFRPPYLPGMPGVVGVNEPITVNAMEHAGPIPLPGTMLRQPTPKVYSQYRLPVILYGYK
jgi:hypothetical protein